MQAKQFVGLGLIVAGCHFLACLTIVPFTLWIGEVLSAGTAKKTLMGGLHFLTKFLYYPILSYALYPRHWFPGSWITIPILVNSMIWGLALAGLVMAWRQLQNGN